MAEDLETGNMNYLKGTKMECIKATSDMVESIYNILHTTIKTIYPKYFPKEVVDFFAIIIVENTF